MEEQRDIGSEEFVNPTPRMNPRRNPEMVQVPRNMLDAMVRMSEALATRHQQTEED
ncbi:MAG: hypothetical protein GY845_13760 [Planctomycetes bacterium]|nr:hypothetical protein [Planctomycetota bacterium]